MNFFRKFLFIIFIFSTAFILSGCVPKADVSEKITGYDQKTYHSEKFGFSLEFPDNWKNNFIIKEDKKDEE